MLISAPANVFWQTGLRTFASRFADIDVPLRVRLWNGAEAVLGTSTRVMMTVRTPLALRDLLNPSLGNLGRAYVEERIDVDGSLDDIIDVATRLSAGPAGHSWRKPARPSRHTRKSDSAAIAHHYDVSNDFYARWLDERMVYSCAYFRDPGDSLEVAQLRKIDHILTKLRVRPGDRLLDVGCGWGALAMRAADRFGAKVLGITLSRNQAELAQERIAAAGLADRCKVRVEDYRDVTGTFDRISSVGMFEHVGLKNLRGYFAKTRALLADDGVALNHGITSTEVESGQSPWGGGDFIDRYVFPQGELPHISLTLREMCAAGLEPVDVENLRRHYALTLSHWTKRFEAARDDVRKLAGEKRWRIWRMYLAGCTRAFASDWVALHQILAVKAGADVLPLTRDYMYSR